MIKICCLTVFTSLSMLTVRNATGDVRRSGIQGFNLFVLIAAFFMVCLIGLRTEYNDTSSYINGFMESEPIWTVMNDLNIMSWTKNPLFFVYTAALRSITDNYHIYFMIPAVFIVFSYLKFFFQECERDTLPYCLFLFFTFGTYFFSLAAMKQSIAMAILTYAIVALQRKQRIRFILIVCMAGLFHTYAFLFLILLFFDSKPWGFRTWAIMIGTIVIMRTFQSTLLSVLQYADSIGKTMAQEGLFDKGSSMNFFRVAVYGVTPTVLFLGNPYLKNSMDDRQNILTNMSVFSFMFMLLGTISGANLFGRMGKYFEVGSVLMLPWAINNMFHFKSARIVRGIMLVAFFGFFLYDHRGFDTAYSSVTFGQFILGK